MTNSIIELEPVATSQPESESLPITQETDKPILTNAFGAGPASKSVAADPDKILAGITGYTSGWPKCAAGQLIVKSADGKLRSMKKEAELFAWLHEHFTVMWRSSPGIPKSEFFEFCRNNSEQYDDISNAPHFPAVDGILYDHPEPEHAEGEVLEAFLDFFNPATPVDRELIKAFLLTMFWGGEPGQRPAFLVTTDGAGPNKGVGAGKTTLITKCSELCGGFLSTSQTEAIETLKKRILSQANGDASPRVIAYDNVKTRRFSSAELESLITARQISGHRMYLGNSAVPNLHTIAITINGANLSSDLAKRCIVITLADAVKSQTWLQSLNEFIDQNRWTTIGDIGHLLTSDAHPLPDEGSTRWAAWEHGVLSRVNQPEDVRTQIVAKQGSVDDDSANDKEFVSHIEENMERFKIYPSGIARIQHHDMHTLLKEFLGQSVGKNVVTKKIEAFGIPCLHQITSPGKARLWLFRVDGEPITPEQIEDEMTSFPT